MRSAHLLRPSLLVGVCLLALGSEYARGQSAAREPSPPQKTVEERLAALEEGAGESTKDFWDKLQAVSGMLSGVLVALIGFYAANIYNRRQKEQEEARKNSELSLNQAAVVEKFLSHLSSSDEGRKEAALVTISSLVSEDLAAQLAVRFGGEGGGGALAKIAITSAQKAPDAFEDAFGQLFAALRPSVVRIEVNRSGMANGFFVDAAGTVVTAAHVVAQADAVHVRTTDGQTVPAKILWLDKGRDLAFLSSDASSRVVPVTFAEAEVELGMRVVALWESPTQGLRGEVGTVSAVEVSTQLSQVDEIGVSISRVLPGISGAPVVDTRGRLVGLIHAFHQQTQLTYVIPSAEIAGTLAARATRPDA